MAYHFPTLTAWNPFLEIAMPNMGFQVFHPDDTAYATPLIVTNGNDQNVLTIYSGTLGIIGGFYNANEPIVVIRDVTGAFAWVIISEEGRIGPPGPDGAAATLFAGTTTTGNPGTNAAVTQTGTPSARTFNFAIPRGAAGSIGPEGPAGAGGGASILDHGAVMDGITDDLDAFTAAFAAGDGKVYVPPGTTAIRSSVLMPSNSEIWGAGMGKSIIKLAESAVADNYVISNSTRATSNDQIYVHDLTLDWNKARQGGLTAGGGGSRGSGLCFSNVDHGFAVRVESINSVLHSFDACQGAIDYPYNGDDATQAPNPSRYIYFDQCIARGWGDDGFSTHHSEYIFISNCYAEFPTKRGNNNGFEVDDGSRHVFLSNNTSRRCSSGLEVKAHGNAPAATDVHINGHMSIEDQKSYQFRHIGHGPVTISPTAWDITAVNLVSYHPGNYDNFYPGEPDNAEVKVMQVGSYRNVSITNLTAIGNPALSYAGNGAMIRTRDNARNVSFSGINMRGFSGAVADINISGFTGPDSDMVSLSNINLYDSADVGIDTDGNVLNISVNGLNAIGPTGGTQGVLFAVNGRNRISNSTVTGYATKLRSSGVDYLELEDYEPSPWENMVLLEGYTQYQGSVTPGANRVMRKGNEVTLELNVQKTTGTLSPGVPFFILSERYRPVNHTHVWFRSEEVSTPALVRVRHGGHVELFDTGAVTHSYVQGQVSWRL